MKHFERHSINPFSFYLVYSCRDVLTATAATTTATATVVQLTAADEPRATGSISEATDGRSAGPADDAAAATTTDALSDATVTTAAAAAGATRQYVTIFIPFATFQLTSASPVGGSELPVLIITIPIPITSITILSHFFPPFLSSLLYKSPQSDHSFHLHFGTTHHRIYRLYSFPFLSSYITIFYSLFISFTT